ncbi:Ig-like domain-containing protein [Nonomuraea sp. NBC_00507]|uniref:Ig-like domain-containing protein n=1 Tax=Nonomuraea sp. NBC_00507 TaxID=2976002 RepID=UPI002E1767A0
MPAFPAAEGAGMYATGGRGGEVVEVTTLDDSGPGSLREAVAGSDRTIVFRVSGNIHIKGGLDITGSNITIAGQTAPGHGISVVGNETKIAGNNIIIRYLRFRGGDVLGTPIDTLTGRGVRDIVIDHCSISWGVDECLSVYGCTNVTVQWCVISEGLDMSVHPKDRHGMGGLWGGDHITYHHNLLVHNSSRNPRFSFTEGLDMIVDHRNNVIYNHGFTSCYGGEWANGVNMVGNYYKPGPNTLAAIAPVIVAPGRFGKWHVSGNHVEDHPEVTRDNVKGITFPTGGITLLPQPVPFEHGIDAQTPAQAYAAVLEGAGAILPRRDSIDARLINEVRTGTGRVINSQREVGGWALLPQEEPPADGDHDGMPDDWERAQGLNPADPADRNTVGRDGYTNLERYLNSIRRAGARNPEVALTQHPDQVLTAGKSLTLEARAKALDGAAIAKVEFFAEDEKIGEAAAAPYRMTWANLSEGTHHLTARATDSTGTMTASSMVPLHVVTTTATGAWQGRDVGRVPIPGTAAIDGDVITVRGSGKVAGWRDSFFFLHQQVESKGQVEIIARAESLSRAYAGAVAGVMIRESLEPDSPFMMGGLTFYEGGKRGMALRVAQKGSTMAAGPYPPIAEDPLDAGKRHWLRLVAKLLPGGDTEFQAFLADESLAWTRIGYERIYINPSRFFIGLAVDGGQEANAVHSYTTARFSAVKITQ